MKRTKTIAPRLLRVVHPVPMPDEERPRTRSDCEASERPCPWVGCRHHLFLDVTPAGSIRFNFPASEPHDLDETCALDVAEEGGHTLDLVGQLLNLTRERVRQIEVRSLIKLRPRTGRRSGE